MQTIKKIREWTYKHAILAAFIVFILYKILILGLGKLLSLLPVSIPTEFFKETILIIIPIAIVVFFGFSSTFKKGNFFKGLLCALPFFILELILFIGIFVSNTKKPELTWNPWIAIVIGIFSIIGIGIREECVYRATIQNIVAKKHANSVKGIWITVTISSVIFGLTHVTNIFYGTHPLSVLSQVISATSLGFLFAAIYLRSGSIWAAIFIHSLTDFASLSSSIFFRQISDIDVTNSLTISWSSLIFDLLYLGLAIFLLRPSKCNQIYKRFCFADEKADLSIDA